jgi:hypothetical protein
VWRELEVGLRLASPWPAAFHGLQASPDFAPATRLLMLASIGEQAEYLRRFHGLHPNHLLMEMNGLAQAAVSFPEFRAAESWFDYAASEMLPQLDRQVYPDEAQNELSSSYHLVVLRQFEHSARLAERRAGGRLAAGYRFEG